MFGLNNPPLMFSPDLSVLS